VTAQESVEQAIERLEAEWNKVCVTLEAHESALVEVYLGFLRHVARTCIEKGWRVWYRANRWTHWGEGGFGILSILLPGADTEPHAALATEIRFMAEAPDGSELGEEITLTTLDRIAYQPDPWVPK
jgi:hypothetical protein